MPSGMRDPISVRKLLAAIRKLPSDEPVHKPKKWYLTQHEHWIGWLSEYDGQGAYGATPRSGEMPGLPTTTS